MIADKKWTCGSHFHGSTELIIAWLGRQFWNQTFDDEVEVNVEEMRELLS